MAHECLSLGPIRSAASYRSAEDKSELSSAIITLTTGPAAAVFHAIVLLRDQALFPKAFEQAQLFLHRTRQGPAGP